MTTGARLSPTTRRGLMVGGALTLLLAGSLAFAAPTFAQDTEPEGEVTTGEVTEDTTVSTDDSAGSEVVVGDSGEAAPAAPAAEAAPADTTAAGAEAAAPAAPATGAAAPTTLPSTGVGTAGTDSLPLIGLAAAGALAAGAVAIRTRRQAEIRA